MSLPRFHHAPIDLAPGSTLILDGPEARHATRVLRLAAGDRAVVFDGAGVAVLTEVVGGRGERLELRVLEAHTASRELPIAITVAPAVLKGDAMDALIRDATMLGATAIAPIVTARTVVPARASASATVVERWRRVALASVKQCGRSVLPAIAAARPLDAALRDPAWADATRLILCEPEVVARRCRRRRGSADAAGARRRAVRPRGRLDAGGSGARHRPRLAAVDLLAAHAARRDRADRRARDRGLDDRGRELR